MPNTNTIYSLFESNDSICFLEQTETDTFEICPPITVNLPYTKLNSNNDFIIDRSLSVTYFVKISYKVDLGILYFSANSLKDIISSLLLSLNALVNSLHKNSISSLV